VSASTSGPGVVDPAPRAEVGAVHVLVVDDEAPQRRSLARVLETRGMQVGVAESGAQALEYVRRTPPDVALVDVAMPGIGGLEVLARLRAMVAPPEVVVMTALADVDSAVAAMKGGAYHFLTKPFHSNDAVAHAVAMAAEHRGLARRVEQAQLPQAQLPHTRALLADLVMLPYADAKRRLVALFDVTYTTELLSKTNGNMSEAARRAGLDRSNFRRLLKRRRDG
jgi:DNA-binding NtrC family response regulator